MSQPHGDGTPFDDDDETLPYTLDSTYWDPNTGNNLGNSEYQPPNNMFGPSNSAGDDAFAAGSQATAAGHGAVPSANDGPTASSAPANGSKPNHVVLSFEETARPAADVTGRIGSDSTAAGGRQQPSSAQQSAPRSADGLAAQPLPPDVADTFSVFNIKRYRCYFNVDTQDVISRMVDSVVGFWKADFLEKTTNNADLYGPFWIATTLIFVSAVAGNCASYLAYAAKYAAKAAASDQVWYYDINKVSYSAVLYYGYVGVVGLAAWGVLRYFSAAVSLAQVWCIYGYALTIYIPAAVVCILPMASLRWGLTAGATATSALFILANLRAPIFENVGAKALPLYLGLAAAHAALGLGMVLYFFQY